MKLALIILHPAEFSSRTQRVQQTVSFIAQAAKRLNLEFEVRQTPAVKPAFILSQELKSRIGAKPVGINIIDDYIDDYSTLSAEQVTHWFHHEMSVRAAHQIAKDPNDLIWIIEDDATLIEKDAESIFKTLKQAISNTDWKLLFTGACNLVPAQAATPDPIRPLSILAKPITNESYLLRSGFVEAFLAEIEHIRCPYAGYLWYIAHKHPNSTFGLSKPLTFDGSKLGLFPSTLSSTSSPILNKDFVALKSACEQSSPDPVLIKTLFKKLEKLQCANGILPYITYLQSQKKLDEAHELAEEAFVWKSQKGGIMGPDCPLLNILLPEYKKNNQEKVKEIQKNPSRFGLLTAK